MARTTPHPFHGLHHFPWGSRRLSALCVVLGLLTFLVVSGPHRVHHLFEPDAPSDHQSHDSHAQPLPDCPVFALTQQTSFAESCAQPLLTPLPLEERLWLEPSRRFPENLRYSFQTRAPPSWPLRDSLSS
jgi:hypothetical protein